MKKIFLRDKNVELFDDILSTKIGLGISQYLIISCFFLLYFYDGAEVIVVAFVLPIIKNEWNLSQARIQLVGSMIFLGWGLGAFMFGYISDKYGRKKTAKFAILLQIISGFLSAFSLNYIQFTLLRCLFGVSTGLACPLISCYTTEIIPKESRGKMFTLILNMFALGEIAAIGLAMIFLQNLTQGNWRIMLVYSCIPSIISYFLQEKYLIESPRFQLCCTQSNHDQVFENLDQMGKKNNPDKYQPLSLFEKEQLIQWSKKQFEEQKEQTEQQILKLFQNQNCKLTIKLMIMWFSLSFVYYGVMYVLPFIIIKIRNNTNGEENIVNQQKHKSIDFFGIFLSCFAQVPSNILVYFTIDNPKYGRRKGLVYSYSLCALVSVMIYFIHDSGFIFFILIGLVKFFINYCFGIMYPFTAEVYVTALRSAGTGLNNSVCRLGGVLMPWITFSFFVFGDKGPFLSFFIVTGLSALSAISIKQDTTNISLDIYGKDEYIEMQSPITNR